MTEPLRIVGVSGSLREPSKTTALVRELIDEVAAREPAETRLIEVATLGPLFAGALRREDLQPEVEDALRAIETRRPAHRRQPRLPGLVHRALQASLRLRRTVRARRHAGAARRDRGR